MTERTLAAAGISPEIAHDQLVGAAIHAPSGARYDIGGDRVHAYVLDRTERQLFILNHREGSLLTWPATTRQGYGAERPRAGTPRGGSE